MLIELKGILRADIGEDRVTLAVKGTVTIDELKTILGIDPGIPIVACKGEEHLKSTHLFYDSDNITLLPVVAGG